MSFTGACDRWAGESCRVVDAPWRQGYDVTDFFNYGLNPGRWKAYAREVQQACAQLRLQEAVVLYNPSPAPLSADPDLPAELKTALMAKVARPFPSSLVTYGTSYASVEHNPFYYCF